MFTLSGKPICRPIHTGIFHAPEYLSLSESGNGRLVMLFLLIHPHGGTFHLPGLYQTGPDSMREALNTPKKPFQLAFKELHDAGVIQSDDQYRLIWMPCALRLVGPPVSPNVVRGYCRSLSQLPPSPLVQQAIPAYWRALQPYGHHFVEPFEKAFESLLEGLVEGFAKGSGSLVAKERNRNQNRDLYPHSNSDTWEGGEEDIRGEGIAYLRKFGLAEGWPESSLAKIPALAQANPKVTLTALRAAEAALRASRGTKDPASYLFAIARNRLETGGDTPNGLSQVNGAIDPSFAGCTDGQSVSFDD